MLADQLFTEYDIRQAEREARACRIIADILYRMGFPYEDFDIEAVQLEDKARRMRKCLSN